MQDVTSFDQPAERSPWTDKYMAGGTPGQPAASLIDVATVRGALWRQRWILAGVTSLALILGLVATLLTTPIYEATSSVRVDPEQGDIFQGESLSPDISVTYLDSYLATLGKVVESRSLALRVVDALKLANDDSFVQLTAADRPAGLSDAQWQARRRDAAAGRLAGNIKAEVPQGMRLVLMHYRSDDPVFATRIANAYADGFLTDDLRRSLAKNTYAQRYLLEEIGKVRSQLDEAQRGALAYARANNIVGEALISGASGKDGETSAAPQTITASRLASVTGTVSDARAQRIAAEERWRAIAGAPASSLPEFQSSSSAQALQTTRATVASQLSEARVRYGSEHPQVQELQAQLSTIDSQLAQIGAGIKAGLRKNYEVALRQEQALSGELNRVSGQTLDEQDRRVAFNQLNDNSNALQTQLSTLLSRYNQISASANVQPSTITLLDRAVQPYKPISPNLFKNLLVALVLGGGAALGLAVLRETIDDRLRSAEDVETKLGIPLLGITPLVDAADDMAESPVLAEAYYSIRAALDFALEHRDHNIIQLTSSQSVEGKTTTAVALAKEYARLGRKVLLIDGDLRRPSIANAFGIRRGKKGFAEVLSGDATLAESLLDQPLANLDVLPVGAIPPNPVEIISSQRMVDFFAQQRPNYDLIIVDSPPIMGIADAPLISRMTDGVVFVVESNRAHFGQAKTALRRLRYSNANILGTVLTKFHALDAGESYKYQYTYYTYAEKTGADKPGKD